MASYNYSAEGQKDKSARASGTGLTISTKKSIEVCSFLRGKPVKRAKTILAEIITQKTPIPYKRFNGDTGHKPGIGPGRCPVKAAKVILEIVESAEANAKFNGINTDNLVIKHISAQRGPGIYHYGRQRRRKMKNTHIEIIVEEGVKKQPKEKAKPQEAKQ